MKNDQRPYPLFSLCGLNCALCPIHLNQYCPGCGGGKRKRFIEAAAQAEKNNEPVKVCGFRSR